MGGLRKTVEKVHNKLTPGMGKINKKIETGVWGEDPEPPPDLPPPQEMPDEEAVARARKRTNSRRRGGGRAGTILSDDGLGG